MTDSKNTPGSHIQVIDKEIFELHNNIRKNPQMLIEDLEQMIE